MTPASEGARRRLSIVAPVSCAGDVRAVAKAGASEVYCGAMFDEWVCEYGDADFLTRRQGRIANARTPADLAAIARAAGDLGLPAHLTLNMRYCRSQEPAVLDLASLWHELGGAGVLVSDIGLMLALQERGAGPEVHLSIMAGAFNAESFRLFSELGVRRAVLPRELSPEEVLEITTTLPAIDYEMIVVNQKCEFIDSFCGFYHGTHFPDDRPVAFDRGVARGGGPPTVWSHDLSYEGHACEIPFQTPSGVVSHASRDDEAAPHCAACALGSLSQAGVRFLKVAGRGYPTEMIVRSVEFLQAAVGLGDRIECGAELEQAAIDLYAGTFGAPCARLRCYYPAWREGH